MKKDNEDPIVIQSACKEPNNTKEICHSSWISHDVSSDILASQITTTPHSCLDVDKEPIRSVDCSRTSRKNDRRRKAKLKKRLMVDILAVAKPCSLEDVCEMNRENADTNAAAEKGLRGVKQASTADHGCNSEFEEDCSNQKLEIHGYEQEGYPNLLGQNRWALKGQIHRLQIQV